MVLALTLPLHLRQLPIEVAAAAVVAAAAGLVEMVALERLVLWLFVI